MSDNNGGGSSSSAAAADDDNSYEEECVICLEELGSEPWGRCTPCQHAFHKKVSFFGIFWGLIMTRTEWTASLLITKSNAHQSPNFSLTVTMGSVLVGVGEFA